MIHEATAVGFCQCGCGQRTAIASKNRAECGWIKGQPIRYVRGHNAWRDWRKRFADNTERAAGCWKWLGHKTAAGYGSLSVRGVETYAHRLSCELEYGPIGRGLEIDHLCRVRACVNPAHLEAVTHAENIRRGQSPGMIAKRLRATSGSCRNGHPASEWNDAARRCRACARDRKRNYHQANRERLNTEKKAWVERNKERVRERQRAWYERNKEHAREYAREYQRRLRSQKKAAQQ